MSLTSPVRLPAPSNIRRTSGNYSCRILVPVALHVKWHVSTCLLIYRPDSFNGCLHSTIDCVIKCVYKMPSAVVNIY